MFPYRRQEKSLTFAPHHLFFRPSQDFLRPEQSPFVQAQQQADKAILPVPVRLPNLAKRGGKKT